MDSEPTDIGWLDFEITADHVSQVNAQTFCTLQSDRHILSFFKRLFLWSITMYHSHDTGKHLTLSVNKITGSREICSITNRTGQRSYLSPQLRRRLVFRTGHQCVLVGPHDCRMLLWRRNFFSTVVNTKFSHYCTLETVCSKPTWVGHRAPLLSIMSVKEGALPPCPNPERTKRPHPGSCLQWAPDLGKALTVWTVSRVALITAVFRFL